MTTMNPAAAGPARRGATPWHPMVWVTWRQDRATLLGSLALLGGLAVLLAISGSAMQALWMQLGLDRCPWPPTAHDSCYLRVSEFENRFPVNRAFYIIDGLHLIPVLIGMFAGAPLLARELESGTFRFAWTQGVGRTRWLAAKLVLLAIPLTLMTYALGQLFTWWLGIVDYSHTDRWAARSFDVGGSVLAAWTLLAFAIGTFAGVAIRQTVKAMAATAAASGVLAVFLPLLIHPILLAQFAITGPAPYASIGARGDLVLDHGLTDPNGSRLTGDSANTISDQVSNLPAGQADIWLSEHHYTYWILYEPANRYWIMQTVEAAGLTILALLISVATIRWVRHRAA
jgi:hypothetical protein